MNEDTNYSLITRALDLSDEEAWGALYEHYQAFVYHVLMQTNLSGLEKDDVVQEVMMKLMSSLPSYDKSKGRFRSWFAQMIRYIAIGAFRKSTTDSRRDDNYFRNESIRLEGDVAEIDTAIEAEWKQYVTRLALERVKTVFNPQYVEMFIESINGTGAQELSQRLGLEVHTIYKYRDRIKRRLKLEVSQLINDLEPPTE